MEWFYDVHGGGGRDVNAKLNEVAFAMENTKGIFINFYNIVCIYYLIFILSIYVI